MLRWFFLGATGLILGLYLITSLQAPSPSVSSRIDLQKALYDETGTFAEVIPGRDFAFPRDHGPHPDYKTEWWYFTGNLEAENGERFGYQLTLFRIGLTEKDRQENESRWATDFLMMGHLGLSRASKRDFFTFERFARGSLGLAGVHEDGEKIWLEDWSIHRSETSLPGWKLQANVKTSEGKDLSLKLNLTESKAPVLQGDGGYSRKGPNPEHASYYVSQTRLATQGTIGLADREYRVIGDSWFDHEWSSESMSPGLVGWDWFSLQLSDNSELMLYLLRYEDGRLEPASSGAVIDPSGKKHNLSLEQFTVTALDTYTSGSGIEYPSEWEVSIPDESLSIKVKPVIPNQEMLGAVPYWEGAVDVQGTRASEAIKGKGFVELTGY